MSELKRVLLNVRAISFLLLAVALGCIFFVYELGTDKQVTLQGQELQAYLDDYPEFLQSVRDNAATLSTLSVSNNVFFKANLVKTTNDYSRLEAAKLIYGNNKGIVILSSYTTSDLLLLAFIIFIASSFTRERRKGLDLLIHTTVRGRGVLTAQRIGIILVASLAASLLLILSLIAVGTLQSGDMGLNRPIQSIPEFKLCAAEVTVGGYLLIAVFLKALAAFSAGLLLYLFTVCLEPTAAIVGSALCLTAEYLLTQLIVPTDRLSWLKYANITALFSTDAFFKGYYNLNLFGAPIGFLTIAAAFTLFAAIITAILLVIASCRPVVKRTGLLDRLKCFYDKKRQPLPLFLWECKKTLLNQKGVLIVAAAIYISISAAMQFSYVYPQSEYLTSYWEEYGNREVTAELTAEIGSHYESIGAEIQALEDELDALYETQDYSIYEARRLAEKIEDAKKHYIALGEVKAVCDADYAYSSESGRTTVLIRQTGYNVLLSKDKATTNKNSFLILLAMLGVFAGLIANERQCGMSVIMRTSRRGNRGVIVRKLGLIAVVAAVLSLCVNLTQLIQIASEVGLDNSSVPAQSVLLLQNVPISMSISAYLCIMYLLRIAAAFAVGVGVMAISRISKSTVISAGISVTLIALPAFLMSMLGMSGVLSLLSFGVAS